MKTDKQRRLEKQSFLGGLEGEFLTDDMLDLLNVPNNMRGYLVKSVAKGSPGDEAGLRGGNRVVTIDGKQMVVGRHPPLRRRHPRGFRRQHDEDPRSARRAEIRRTDQGDHPAGGESLRADGHCPLGCPDSKWC